ncbi:MAG: biopolymer transporter ExbD [Sulfuricella sp.]|jgi:biopolymer transport protein ExbD
MKRRAIFDEKAHDEINLTPLLDLAWCLLVVFIMTITASIQGIKVNLPQASDAPSLSKPRTKAVSIAADGQLYLDAYPVNLEQLESTLRQYKAADPDLPVVVKGDAQVQYQSIISVMDVLQRVDIHQLGLVTQRLVK